MTVAIAERHREAFRRIADHLIPAAEGMPAASEVDVHGAGLETMLTLRPELAPDLARALDAVAALGGPEAVAALAAADPEGLAVVGLVAASAYYMAPSVHAALDYPGQRSRPVQPEEEGDYLEGDLLQAVIDRGPIYRPTP